MIFRILSVLLLLLPSLVLAAEAAKEPKWWEVVTGIIAIPAAIIGVVYSILLIKKTRVEVRKMELEIHEKEISLEKVANAESHFAQALINPLIGAKSVQLLLLRFVLLYVTLRLWGLAADAYDLFLGSAFLGVQKLISLTVESDNLWIMIPMLLISKLPKLGELAIILGIGAPLFRDVSTTLGVDLRSIIFFRRK
jgi:hypothetical protein